MMFDKHEKAVKSNGEAGAHEEIFGNSYIEPSNEGGSDCFEPDMNVMGDIYGSEADIEWIDDAVLLWNEFEENNEDKNRKNSITNLSKEETFVETLFDEIIADAGSSRSKIIAKSTQSDSIKSTKKVIYESLDDFFEEK